MFHIHDETTTSSHVGKSLEYKRCRVRFSTMDSEAHLLWQLRGRRFHHVGYNLFKVAEVSLNTR